MHVSPMDKGPGLGLKAAWHPTPVSEVTEELQLEAWENLSVTSVAMGFQEGWFSCGGRQKWV